MLTQVEILRLLEFGQGAATRALGIRILTLQVEMCWNVWMRPELQYPSNRNHLLLLSSIPDKLA